ncbi:MAG: Transcriptional regulator, HxlR family [uncultured Truepera sp.]|uniref:Transcriptional regulator, HxlR family n=1 Tax=uncultured Truepera sp. TaxID=543023 RepID=A0A6J4VSC7_9DEIN|nr:MAG: Transcriptional regulator, HxlR family [uncultured Truepera sp.]
MKDDFCPIYASINLLQEKWTLHIVRSLLEGPRGFNELGRDIGGCNPTTLTQRLERLEASGIVEKTVQSTMPPRTRYTLTEAGLALQGVVDAVDRWGRQFLNAPPTEQGVVQPEVKTPVRQVQVRGT